MTALESRKRLLLAESELNRAQLAEDLTALRDDVRALGDRVQAYGSVASSAAMLMSALAAYQRGKQEGAPKHSWLKLLIKAAGLVSTIWLAVKAKEPAQEEG